MSGGLRTHIARRASQAGLSIDPVVADKLAAYVELLARWNKTVNLTALELTPPTDDAIDRLLIEPLVAAFRIDPADRIVIDVGSGGGSPAIPMKIAAPRLEMTLVESRLKKAAFLREAVRHLELTEVDVENRRLEELAARVDLRGQADIVTLRAVTPTVDLWGSIERLLRTGGRVFWFGGRPDPACAPAMTALFGKATTETISTPPRSQLSILQV
ncbi:MAG TPA: 16S rRNA (guanine(527)-N(7))-methyltransferase RsmG [Vicinamibacterales bacterium]|nr:16S rRNA (guanine(527)-N(7))-methyltransferase RsmG [Vicinamibacterales bacterium]